MTEEFGIYINMWKNDKSIGCEIMHKIMSTELAKNFSMYGNGWVVGERQEAFMLTNTYLSILEVLCFCDDSVSGQKVRSSITTFLKEKKPKQKSPVCRQGTN